MAGLTGLGVDLGHVGVVQREREPLQRDPGHFVPAQASGPDITWLLSRFRNLMCGVKLDPYFDKNLKLELRDFISKEKQEEKKERKLEVGLEVGPEIPNKS